MKAMLAALWQRNLPVILERLAILDAAATTANLDPAMRAEALATAHKLAGSLGMFGFPEGTQIARKIEHQLESPEALDHKLLTVRATELRKALSL
jgi:HPt (histidine-containing phosphotransfer) domain-containing protein